MTTAVNANGDNSPARERHLRPVLNMTPEQYLEDRVLFKMNVYGKKSRFMRMLYTVITVVSLVCAAIVPVVINFGGTEWLATILSLIVAIAVSLEKAFRFREHWRNYDAIGAFLRREQLYFQTRAEDYKGRTDEDAFRLFVRRIEEGIQQERDNTIEMRTQEAG